MSSNSRRYANISIGQDEAASLRILTAQLTGAFGGRRVTLTHLVRALNLLARENPGDLVDAVERILPPRREHPAPPQR
jgi:hypothetical protein